MSRTRQLTTPQYKLLQEMFNRDMDPVARHYPFQSPKKKVLEELRALDYITPAERKEKWAIGEIAFTGWCFTIRGHMAYCKECSIREPDED